MVPGPWSGQDRGETRARGIGGLKHLENCLGPGADSPSDDGATPMLRATCAQALVAIKATQKQMGLERCTGGPERSWWYSLSPRRFLRLTPARCPHLHPRNTFPSGTPAAPKWHWWSTQGDGAVLGRVSTLPHHPPGGGQPRRPKEVLAATQTHAPTPSPPRSHVLTPPPTPWQASSSSSWAWSRMANHLLPKFNHLLPSPHHYTSQLHYTTFSNITTTSHSATHHIQSYPATSF